MSRSVKVLTLELISMPWEETSVVIKLSYKFAAFSRSSVALSFLNVGFTLCSREHPGQEPRQWYHRQSILTSSPSCLANS